MTLGLLDVVEDTTSVRVGNDASKVGGGILADTGSQNDSLGILVLRQLEHLVQGETTANI